MCIHISIYIYIIVLILIIDHSIRRCSRRCRTFVGGDQMGLYYTKYTMINCVYFFMLVLVQFIIC